MNSEECSITEDSSSRLERGQRVSKKKLSMDKYLSGYEKTKYLYEKELYNGTGMSFQKHHEGSIQVPIPCAVLAVVIITSLSITIIALQVGKYNCPGLYENLESSEHHVASCEDDWVSYQRKCYFFSSTTRSWPSAQNSCSKDGATLAVIDSKKDMVFLKRYAGGLEHWIGLKNEANQTWKWANGKEFNSWFNLTGSEGCASLNNTDVAAIDCEASLHWVCSKSSR